MRQEMESAIDYEPKKYLKRTLEYDSAIDLMRKCMAINGEALRALDYMSQDKKVSPGKIGRKLIINGLTAAGYLEHDKFGEYCTKDKNNYELEQ